MAQNRSDNFNITAPKPADNRYLKNGSTPYTSVVEAHGLLTYKYIGLTVLILKSGIPTEYWYKNATSSSSDLVEKENVSAETLATKQDAQVGKQLSTEDFTSAEKTKLQGIQTSATANATNAQLRDRSTHTGMQDSSTIIGLSPVATAGTYTSLTGKPTIPSTLDQLTDTSTRLALTPSERAKIAATSGTNTGDQDISGIAINTSAIGTLPSLSTSAKSSLVAAINEVSAVANAAAGGGTVVGDNTVTNAKLSADVKVGSLPSLTTTDKTSVVNSINEVNAGKVDKITGKGLSANDYTSAEKTKLASISSGATANSTDTFLLSRTNHTGTQSADTLIDGTTNKAYTSTEKTKLAGIATGATVNSSDATLLNRANHTGSQAASTITEDSTHRFTTDIEKTTWNAKQDASTAATLAGTQTLTNKTITSPIIGTIINGAATLTLPTSTGTIALASQITGINSGVNTGDETSTTIKTKLGITTLSGVNTGDQDLTSYATKTGSETFTNKSISGTTNTLTNIAASSILTADRQTFDPSTKQDLLVNGTNIKSLNGYSLLGSGSLNITSAGDISTQLAALGAPIKYLAVGTQYFTDENQSMEIDMYGGGSQIFTAIYLPIGAIITGAKYRMKKQGNYVASNFNGAALYSVSGSVLTLVKQSANLPDVWKASASSIVTIPFTSTYTVPASGIYYLSTMYSATMPEAVVPQLVTRYGGFSAELNTGSFTNGLFINGVGGYGSSLVSTINVSDIDRTNLPDPTWVVAY